MRANNLMILFYIAFEHTNEVDYTILCYKNHRSIRRRTRKRTRNVKSFHYEVTPPNAMEKRIHSPNFSDRFS